MDSTPGSVTDYMTLHKSGSPLSLSVLYVNRNNTSLPPGDVVRSSDKGHLDTDKWFRKKVVMNCATLATMLKYLTKIVITTPKTCNVD